MEAAELQEKLEALRKEEMKKCAEEVNEILIKYNCYIQPKIILTAGQFPEVKIDIASK